MKPVATGTGWPPGWWFWLLGAPAAVVGGLLLVKNLLVVFAVYQLGFCLVLPAIRNLALRGSGLGQHLDHLGLGGPGTGRNILLGLALGAVFAAGTLGAFRWFGDLFLAGHDVPAVLSAWGVDRSNVRLVFWFMVLANGAVEELYWRGFVHTELARCRPRPFVVLLTAACYASYHGVTVLLLVGDPAVALLFMAAIFGAGVFWGWLRERTGSVWPALLSHAAAAAAYMTVARPLLDF